MSERTIVEVNGRQYQIGRLPALTQLHVARRLMPCLAGLSKMSQRVQSVLPTPATDTVATPEMEAQADEVIGELVQAVGTALASMSDEDVEYIVKTCLKVCYAQTKDKSGWAPMTNAAGLMMDSELQLPDLLGVTLEVIKGNLGGFFPGARAS